jgi:hypothetical protein
MLIEIDTTWTDAPPDIRAEVVASMLFENGVEIEKMLFETVGIFKRNFGSDLVSVEDREVGRVVKKVLTLNREGIYDALPKDLFHLPTESKPTTKKKIDEIKIQRQKEKKSRTFFLPLEQEFYQQRVWIENKELQSYESGKYGSFVDILRRFWQLPDFLTKEQVIEIVPILPTIAQLSGNLAQIAGIFSEMISQKIDIDYAPAKDFQIPYNPTLGHVLLGDDLILSGTISSYLPTLQLTISVQNPEQLPDYLIGGSGLQLVNWLINWLLPADNEVEIKVKLLEDSEHFVLDDTKQYAGRLGYSTVIMAV